MKKLLIIQILLIISFISAKTTIWDLRKVAVAIKASSHEGDMVPEMAVDGNKTTRWSSIFKDNQWIYINLGEKRMVTEIELFWETAYAKEYKIQITDRLLNNWQTIKHIKDGVKGKITFSDLDIETRYIRILVIKRATQWGISLYEFIVKGPMKGIEPTHGGLLGPVNKITIYDNNYEKLGKYFAEQIANDPSTSENMSDDEFLNLVEKRAFDFFWYEVHPESFFCIDSTTWKTHTSVAEIGLQLAAYIIGHYRNYRDKDEIYERTEKLLDHCYDDPNDPNDLCIEHHSGWPYHWVNIETGKWEGHEHVCTHDCLMYFCGIIAAKHYFAGTKAGEIAAKIIDDIDWKWIIHDGKNERFISNCYAKTYKDFCGGEVRFYDGMKFDYLLPIGGIKSNISPEYWHNYVQDFPWDSYNGGYWRIQRPALWLHQWDSFWFDLQYMKDDYTDYYQNSVIATLANRQWTIDRDWYDGKLWGLNPSLGPTWDGQGSFYNDFGAPPDDLPFQKGTGNDYTIATTAALPCIVFTPDKSIKVARYMYDNYKDKIWKRYGFTDALNPKKNWYSKEYIGIDIGPILLNFENYRTGLIYNYFSKEPIVWNGLLRAGFKGIIDTFDSSKYCNPYAVWAAQDKRNVILSKTDEFVKEGNFSLYIKIKNKKNTSFEANLNRNQISHYNYLRFWIRHKSQLDMKIYFITDSNKKISLTKTKVYKSDDNWRQYYYQLPENKDFTIKQVRFELNQNTDFYIDELVLIENISTPPDNWIIETFDNELKHEIISGLNTNIKITTKKMFNGNNSLMVNTDTDIAEVSVLFNKPQDWRKYHSISIWIYGSSNITLKLKDKFNKQYEVLPIRYNDTEKFKPGGIKVTGNKWHHLFFNIQGTLNPNNCWKLRYDKKNISEMKLISENQTDDIYIDEICLTE